MLCDLDFTNQVFICMWLALNTRIYTHLVLKMHCLEKDQFKKREKNTFICSNSTKHLQWRCERSYIKYRRYTDGFIKLKPKIVKWSFSSSSSKLSNAFMGVRLMHEQWQNIYPDYDRIEIKVTLNSTINIRIVIIKIMSTVVENYAEIFLVFMNLTRFSFSIFLVWSWNHILCFVTKKSIIKNYIPGEISL